MQRGARCPAWPQCPVLHSARRGSHRTQLQGIQMKVFSSFVLALALLVGAATAPALAGGSDPLFVNLTTDEPHRANMGITFGRNQHERGHPLTVFLNDKAVLIASKANAGSFPQDEKALVELVA